MAAPMVSGTVGLLLAYKEYYYHEYKSCWGIYPSATLTIEDYRCILKESAIDINVAGFDIYSGYGLIEANAAVNSLRNMLMSLCNGFDPEIGIPDLDEDPSPPPKGSIEPPNPPPPIDF